MESERPTKRANVARERRSFVSALSTAAYSALLSERDGLKRSCEAVVPKNQFIPGSREVARQLRAKVADMKNMNVLAKNTSVKEMA